MSKYVVKRVLLMIPTILGAGILVFLMMRLLPATSASSASRATAWG